MTKSFSLVSINKLCINSIWRLLISRSTKSLSPFANLSPRSHFGEKGLVTSLSINNPLQTVDNLLPILESYGSEPKLNVVIDITTFTRESLLIVLRLLAYFLHGESKLSLVYNTALDYSIGLNLPDKWLSKGINVVRSVLGYPGFSSPINKLHLIVMSGFKDERTAKLIEKYEASIVSIGVGDEASTHPTFHDGNFTYFQRVCSNLQVVDEFTFSLKDPFATKVELQQQIAKYPDHNVTIAPMNNKISTVGAALVGIADPDIQLCYAQANYYNFDAYSTPGHHFYLFDFPIE